MTLSDPFVAPNGITFTPFHILVLLFAALSLLAAQLELSREAAQFVGMWQRVMVLLVISLVIYSIISSKIVAYREDTERLAEELKVSELDKKATLSRTATPWDNPAAHPSAFLTTRDGKPRLFPFPLGKTGGLKGELWWEAGNAPHVGHFDQKETSEAREALYEDMQAKEAARASKAKKEMKAYKDERKKWAKRLANLKILCAIVILGLVNRTSAVICLAGLIYYVISTELAGMLKTKEDEEVKERPWKRKRVPNTPGMAMTYLYEPTPTGVKEYTSIPVNAPSHRLMTTTDNRYAS